MAKKYFCDRCGNELIILQEGFLSDVGDSDEFNNLFDNFGSAEKITKYQLCKPCLKGYNKIIKKTNKEIEAFLKDKES